MKLSQLLYLLCACMAFISCDYIFKKELKEREISDGPFEGKITISESRGLYGSLFKLHTTYFITEHTLKREERMGGLNDVFNTYAGIIIDLKSDSATLYYSDINRKVKHLLSLEELSEKVKNTVYTSITPSPFDRTFAYFDGYDPVYTKEDSLLVNGFRSDYTRYRENFLQQEVYDSKKLNINRKMLELMCPGLPQSTNFVLKSEFKTILSAVKNDSIVNSDGARVLEKLSRGMLYMVDSTEREETDLEKLSKNKWVNMGLDLLKVGVDLNIHISSEAADISSNIPGIIDLSLPSGDFEEIDDFDDFFNSIPRGGDFDD